MADKFYTRRHINLEDIEELYNDDDWRNEFESYVSSEGYVGWFPVTVSEKSDEARDYDCLIPLIGALKALGAEEGETIYIAVDF